MNKIIKIIVLQLSVLLISLPIYAKSASLVSSNEQSMQLSFPMGKVIDKNKFAEILKNKALTSKAYENEFCVGIIDDEEQAMTFGALDYRIYKNKVAIDQVIFTGAFKSVAIEYDNLNFTSQTNELALKRLKKVEVFSNEEKGVLIDRISQKKYNYSKSYSIRRLNHDDLLHVYFANGKLIGLNYIVQC